MKAAVMRAIGEPLRIEDIQVDGPGLREALVRTAATGVCHSDLHVLEGSLPTALPTVLGHEPAGVVEAVGAEVRHVAPGDHVIGCLSAFCGACEYCLAGRPNLCEGEATMRRAGEPPRLSKDGEPIVQFVHLSAFAERMLVHENALVRIRRDVPLDRAALIGCGVTTGLGAVFNTARLPAGRTAAIIGCGGIGLSVVQGCRIAGAARIVAVDTAAWKLDLAARLGATDVIDADAGNPVPAIVEMTSGGVDYAFEAIGTPATVRQAVRMTRKGGTIVMIGVDGGGDPVEEPPPELERATDGPAHVGLERRRGLRSGEAYGVARSVGEDHGGHGTMKMLPRRLVPPLPTRASSARTYRSLRPRHARWLRTLALAVCLGLPVPSSAETVFVKYRGPVDLAPFDCQDVTRSSLVNRVCYDKHEQYMISKLRDTYYHYCEIPAGIVSELRSAESMGRYHNTFIRGNFDCRINRVPPYK